MGEYSFGVKPIMHDSKKISTGNPAPRQLQTVAQPKLVNLALQGGGSHGAFTWGVVDRLLEDRRIGIDAISGTSAGSMNAVVIAHGYLRGRDGARQALQEFWKAVSDVGMRLNPIAAYSPLLTMRGGNPWQWAIDQWSQVLSRTFTPPARFAPIGIS